MWKFDLLYEFGTKPGRRQVLRGIVAASTTAVGALGSIGTVRAQSNVGAPPGRPVNLGQLVELAKREGQVTVYSASGAAVLDKAAAAFRQRYGIAVELFNAIAAPLIARVNQEVAVNRLLADVVQVSDDVFFDDLTRRKLLAPLDTLPAYAAWPDRIKSQSNVQFSIVPNGILYNTKLASAPLRDWPDLLHPSWRGRMLLTDPNAAISFVGFLGFLRRRYGDDFLRQLAAQKLRLATGGTPAGEQVAAGEAALHFPSFPYIAVNLAKRGAPVVISVPQSTNGVERRIGAFAGGPHPNAGLLFANFALSPEGQTVFNGDQQGATGLSDIPGAVKLPLAYEPADTQRAYREKDEIMRLIGLR